MKNLASISVILFLLFTACNEQQKEQKTKGDSTQTVMEQTMKENAEIQFAEIARGAPRESRLCQSRRARRFGLAGGFQRMAVPLRPGIQRAAGKGRDTARTHRQPPRALCRRLGDH